MTRPRLLLLELNEVNFEMLSAYANEGHLPHFAALLGRHGYCKTSSETRYEHLEPWIQWVTAHTGLRLEEHRVFRLGDITSTDYEQIWEKLEREHGLKSGALSPMNARNRSKSPAFFIPDPWTDAEVVASPSLRRLFGAIRQTVNDNSSSRITPRSALALGAGLARYAAPSSYDLYAKLIVGAGRRPWNKALLLDLLLGDLFLAQLRETGPDFASLFVNAAAHVQHHYFFNSKFYTGGRKNPDWYVDPDLDPVLDSYRVHDRILGRIRRAHPEARLMLATGLHQVPHECVTYYWRLRDHESFLRQIDAPFSAVEPRMSRDFLVRCRDDAEARQTAWILENARAEDGLPLFEVDNRGDSLFVMLSYPRDVGDDFVWKLGERAFTDFRRAISFVAIKNGQHDGTGYFMDTGLAKNELPDEFPLSQLTGRITEAVAA